MDVYVHAYLPVYGSSLLHCFLLAPPPEPVSEEEEVDHPDGVLRQASVSSTTATMADPTVIKPHVWQLAYQALSTLAQPVSGLVCYPLPPVC